MSIASKTYVNCWLDVILSTFKDHENENENKFAAYTYNIRIDLNYVYIHLRVFDKTTKEEKKFLDWNINTVFISKCVTDQYYIYYTDS